MEWLGQRLRLGPLAVGTILAAFGTALPESVVTFVAVVLGPGASDKDVGVGAAMGGPLALATIAYGVTGTMMLLQRRRARISATERGHLLAREKVPADGPPPMLPAAAPAAEPSGIGDLGKLARDQR